MTYCPVPLTYDPTDFTSSEPVNEIIYSWLRKCFIFLPDICKSVIKKAEKRREINLIIPAKDKAPLSKTSSEK